MSAEGGAAMRERDIRFWLLHIWWLGQTLMEAARRIQFEFRIVKWRQYVVMRVGLGIFVREFRALSGQEASERARAATLIWRTAWDGRKQSMGHACAAMAGIAAMAAAPLLCAPSHFHRLGPLRSHS